MQMLKKRWPFLLVGLLLLGALSFWIVGRYLTAPERVFEHFVSAVEAGNERQVRQLIVSGDKDVATTDEAVKAMLDLLREDKPKFEAVKKEIRQSIDGRDAGSDSLMMLVPSGKKLLFFTGYKIRVEPQTITVKGFSDSDQVDILIHGQTIPAVDRSEGKYGPVLPGRYELNKKVTNELGSFQKKEKMTVWDGGATVAVDTNEWMRSDRTLQKQVIGAVDQFNREVSAWETSGYDPQTLGSATESLKNSHSSQKILEFEEVRGELEEMQSAYLGMVVNLESLEISNYGDRWNASLDILVSYRFMFRVKEDRNAVDASYKRGQQLRLIYDEAQKKWLVNGVEENPAVETSAGGWTQKEEVKPPEPEVHTWHADGHRTEL